MKKIIIVLLVVALVLSITACKSQEQRMMEKAMKDFKDMTGQEEYSSNNISNDNGEDNADLEPNDDGMDDEGNEQAGVGVVDNAGREGETYIEDGENSIQLGGGEWPEDAPEVIAEPEFCEAEISGIITSGNGAVITYVNVGRTEMAELVTSYLNNKDWNMIAHTNDSDREVYSGQNGKVVLTIDWDCGEFSLLWEVFE